MIGRQGRGLPAHEPGQLLDLRHGRGHRPVRRGVRHRRHGLDLLSAVLGRVTDLGRSHGARHLRARHLLDHDGLNFIVTTHTLRGTGLDWVQLPLFVWAIYATAIIQVLATPVLGITLLLLGRRPLLRARPLRPERRRRPRPLSAPLLVLLAPGRLHHDPAGHGCDLRGRVHLQPEEHLRLHGSSPSRRSASPSSASWSGATTCSSAGSRVHAGAGVLRPAHVAGRDLSARSRCSTGSARCTAARSRFKTPMLYALAFIFLFAVGGPTGWSWRTFARHALCTTPTSWSRTSISSWWVAR